MNVDEGLDLGDLRGVVERRWLPAAIVAGVVFLVGVVVAATLPNQYETHTTVLVEPQTISPELVAAQMGGTDLNERLHLEWDVRRRSAAIEAVAEAMALTSAPPMVPVEMPR